MSAAFSRSGDCPAGPRGRLDPAGRDAQTRTWLNWTHLTFGQRFRHLMELQGRDEEQGFLRSEQGTMIAWEKVGLRRKRSIIRFVRERRGAKFYDKVPPVSPGRNRLDCEHKL